MRENNRDLGETKVMRERLIEETNKLMKTLNYSVTEGRAYLSEHYQKISRLQLTDNELTEFRDYLLNKLRVKGDRYYNTEVIKIEFNEILKQINLLMEQLNWTKKDGENYLLTHYQKKSRILLSDRELLEFRDMLQQQLSKK